MRSLAAVVFVGLVAAGICDFTVTPPIVTKLDPKGVRFTLADEAGVTEFAVHYSVNKPLVGAEESQWYTATTHKTDEKWTVENTAVELKDGDVINYWVYVQHDGKAYQLTDQSWTSGNKGTRAVNTEPMAANQCTQYPCLVFEDNFTTFDLSTWQHEITAGGGGNWEFQYYTNNRTNSYVRDGTLYIKPTLTAEKHTEDFLRAGVLNLWGHQEANKCTGNAWWGCERAGTSTNYINPIQSARIRTARSFGVRYGRVEVEAQMPVGDWLWPAIWMLPRYDDYGDWPASGEIDIVESRGNADYRTPGGQSIGNDHASATLHWGPYPPLNGYEQTGGSATSNFAARMHTYAVEWNQNEFRFYIDGTQILHVDPGAGGFWSLGGWDSTLPPQNNPWVSGGKLAPFDKEFFIVMNVAVGGTNGYFHDANINSPNPKPWSDTSGQAPREFWVGKDLWYPSWQADVNNGEGAAMKVNSVRVYKMSADDV